MNIQEVFLSNFNKKLAHRNIRSVSGSEIIFKQHKAFKGDFNVTIIRKNVQLLFYKILYINFIIDYF